MPNSDLSSDEGQRDLVASINESVNHINGFTLSFFATCIYVLIAVGSVSHEALLMGSKMDLPLLNVKVPLIHFFILVPILIAFLHLHLLLQEYLLFCKLTLLKEEWFSDGLAARFAPALPVNGYMGTEYRSSVQLLLRFLRFSIYQILPLSLICWIQLRFVPYHDWTKTMIHQVLVLADIALIYYYSDRLSLLRKKPLVRVRHISPSLRSWVRNGALVLTAMFSLLCAVVPGTLLECMLHRPLPYVDSLLERNLLLRERTLVRQHPDPELLAARHVTRDRLDALYLELATGMDLVGRDLRFADFSGSKLFNADLRGADLGGAILENADLRGAKLMPTGGSDGTFDLPPDDSKLIRIDAVAQHPETYRPVSLIRAKLRGADLRNVKLILADLTEADLEWTHLEGSELTQAKLTKANLNFADLRGVELSRGQLELASLIGAQLVGSRLFRASLVGADLRGAHLEGADLSSARLDGANFAEAHLEAAEFKDSTSSGTIFWSAWLQGSTSLFPDRTILREARMQAVDFCAGTNATAPFLSDLRGVDFSVPANWSEIESRLIYGLVSQEARLRLDAGSARNEPCLTIYRRGDVRQPRREEDLAHRNLLYSEVLEGPMVEWPPLSSQSTIFGGEWGEKEFLGILSGFLWDQACDDASLSQALAKRIVAGYTPVDKGLNKQLACRFKELQSKSEVTRTCSSGYDSIDETDKGKILEMANRASEDGSDSGECARASQLATQP